LEPARPYRDPAGKLEGLIERFQLATQPSDLRRIAQLIIDVGVFEGQRPEEKDPGRADAHTTEVIVTAGGREFKRRYFTGATEPLEPLRTELERQVRRLMKSGKRKIRHQGKPIALPQEPAPKNAGEAEAPTETVPLSRPTQEAARRIDRRLAVSQELVLLIEVDRSASTPAYELAKRLRRALEKKRGLIFSTKKVAGAVPVPSEVPGGHVHMLTCVVEPHPDLVLHVGEMDGRLYVAEREAGKAPLDPTSRWNWILYARYRLRSPPSWARQGPPAGFAG